MCVFGTDAHVCTRTQCPWQSAGDLHSIAHIVRLYWLDTLAPSTEWALRVHRPYSCIRWSDKSRIQACCQARLRRERRAMYVSG